MTEAVYAPRTLVHPTRYGGLKTKGPNRLGVLHTSQGREGSGAAKALADFQRSPATATNVASYAVVFDVGRLVWPCVPYDVVSYSASGANHDGIHGCFPGDAFQTRSQWLDPVSFGYVQTCAAWMIDLRDERGIPLTRLTVAQVKAGHWGWCDHYDVSRAYGKTNHTDVGEGFPWDVLFDEIDKLLRPAASGKDTNMNVIDYKRGTPEWARLVITSHLNWVRATSDHYLSRLVDSGHASIQNVSRTELVDNMKTFGTEGPNPWDQTQDGHAPADEELRLYWEASRRAVFGPDSENKPG